MLFRFLRALQYIKRHRNAKAQAILEQADNPFNLVDSFGNTFLHYAVRYENVGMTVYLIGCGTPVNIQNKNGKTALMIAMEYCHSTAIPILLIEANADINICDKAGSHPLERAIIRFMSDCELWKSIIKNLELKFSYNYKEITNLLVKYDCNLQDIMFVGCSQVTKVMLESGYDANEIDDIGRIALHGAVSFMHLENVKLLVEYGADVNILDSDGSTPIAYVTLGHENVHGILTILMDAGAKMFIPEKTNGEKNQMREILQAGSKDIIRIMMKYNIDFNTKDELGMTALHLLARNINSYVLEELRDKVFDINVKDDYNYTPLELALENPSSVKFLLDKGAKIDPTSCGIAITSVLENLPDEQQLPDKFYADVVILFLQHGADIDAVTPDGVTMFDAAIEYNRFVLIKPVLAHLAMHTALGKPLSATASKRIRTHQKLKELFDFYTQKVKKMKAITVCQSITLYNLLTENEEKIAMYMRNKKLLLKLSRLSNKCGLTTYYHQCIRKNVTEAIRIARLKEGAAIILCQMIQQFSSADAIIMDKIINYIGLEDLKNLYYVY